MTRDVFSMDFLKHSNLGLSMFRSLRVSRTLCFVLRQAIWFHGHPLPCKWQMLFSRSQNANEPWFACKCLEDVNPHSQAFEWWFNHPKGVNIWWFRGLVVDGQPQLADSSVHPLRLSFASLIHLGLGLFNIPLQMELLPVIRKKVTKLNIYISPNSEWWSYTIKIRSSILENFNNKVTTFNKSKEFYPRKKHRQHHAPITHHLSISKAWPLCLWALALGDAT